MSIVLPAGRVMRLPWKKKPPAPAWRPAPGDRVYCYGRIPATVLEVTPLDALVRFDTPVSIGMGETARELFVPYHDIRASR
jgi:hypothetical protein